MAGSMWFNKKKEKSLVSGIRAGEGKIANLFYSVDRFLDEFRVMRSMIWTLHIVHLSHSHAEGGRGWVLVTIPVIHCL
jgi:hypothetical protein